jgi:hypothetical protein
MNKVKKFLEMDAVHRALWIMIAVAVVVFVCLCPLFLLKSEDNYPYVAYPFGWLLGSVIEILAYLTIIKMSKSLLTKKADHPVTMGLALLSGSLRMFLWASGLLVSAICTFKSEWFGGFNAFNFYTCAIAYLPMLFIVLLTQFSANRKKASVSKDSDTDKKEEDR